MQTTFALLRLDPLSGCRVSLPYHYPTSMEAVRKVAELQASEPRFRYIVQVVPLIGQGEVPLRRASDRRKGQ